MERRSETKRANSIKPAVVLFRSLLASAITLLLVALLAIFGCVPGLASARTGHQDVAGHLARTLPVIDTAHLTLAHKGGEYITEEGEAKGTIPGKVRAYLIVGPVVVAKFTIEANGGTISGEGSGRPKGRSGEPSFQGAMTVSRGTGRYKGAHGRGSFYGSLNRSSYRMYVKTTGTLYF
jgi:hypothetical protein